MDSNPRQIGQIPSGQRFRETSPPPRCLMRRDLHGTGFTRPYIHAGTTTYLQHRTRGVVSVVSITKHYTMDSQHAHQPQSNGGRHVTGLLRYCVRTKCMLRPTTVLPDITTWPKTKITLLSMLVTGHYVHYVVQNVISVTLRDYVDFLRRTCKRTEEIWKDHIFGAYLVDCTCGYK